VIQRHTGFFAMFDAAGAPQEDADVEFPQSGELSAGDFDSQRSAMQPLRARFPLGVLAAWGDLERGEASQVLSVGVPLRRMAATNERLRDRPLGFLGS